MASKNSGRATRAQRKRGSGKRARVRVAPKGSGTPVSRGISWKQVPGNWLIVFVLVLGFFYIPPLKGFYEQRKATSAAKVSLQRLGAENRALKSRARALKRESTIATEARKLGMVAPNEKPFVVLR